MLDHLRTYFDGEKRAGLVFALMGLASLITAFLAWRHRPDYRGALYPFVLFGLIELGIGVGLYLRTDAQVAALTEQHQRAPQEMRAGEIARMEPVMRNFRVILIAEGVFIVIGLGLLLGLRNDPFWSALGVGLLMQALALLAFDYFADQRGRTYVSHLTSGAP